MRKVFSIFLITVLLANGVGFYIYFYLRLIEIKKEMQAEIAKTSPETFQRIVLSIDEFSRSRAGNDELEWNDTMYDIASIQFCGDKVEIMALQDEFETELLSFASGIIQSATNDYKSPPSALMQYLSLNFTIPDLPTNSYRQVHTEIVHFTLYHIKTYNYCVSIASPPPRAYYM